jgi:hypothetical protein
VADPYTPDPADVELVHTAWHNAPCPKCGRTARCRCLVDDRGYRARAVLAALAEAGRLLPSDAETRTEWGVIGWGGGRYGTATREAAEELVASAPDDRRLISRTVTVGPWQPVPTTPTTEEASDAS